MVKKPDGGPAFPHGMYNTEGGMSLRDWFAGMALIGFRISNPSMSAAEVSTRSYMDADAMLAEQERKDG